MPESEDWLLIVAILAVPLVIFAVIDSLRCVQAREAQIISSHSKMANRRR
ncbi:MAG: hypothetical protein K2Y20_14565 [Sphingomonas sp.]|nr:hypothetical protein [Sphingomonas sp.]